MSMEDFLDPETEKYKIFTLDNKAAIHCLKFVYRARKVLGIELKVNELLGIVKCLFADLIGHVGHGDGGLRGPRSRRRRAGRHHGDRRGRVTRKMTINNS